MTNIRWTTREWGLIAGKLDEWGVDVNARGFRGHLFEAMQRVLPPERHRSYSALNNAKQMLNNVRKTTPPVARKIEEQETAPALLEVRDASVEQLVEALIQRITERVLAEVVPRLRWYDNRHRHHCPEATEEHGGAARPKVLIVGPRNGQQRELQEAHGEWLDLRFVASEDNPALISNHTCAEHVVLWTNFISHAHQECAKRLPAKIHYVTGGMSKLHEVLKQMI